MNIDMIIDQIQKDYNKFGGHLRDIYHYKEYIKIEEIFDTTILQIYE